MQVEHNATTPLFIAIVYSTKQSKMSDVGASSESDDEEDVKLAGDIISSGLDHEEKVATTAVTAKNTEGYGSKASPKGRRKGTSADDRWEDM